MPNATNKTVLVTGAGRGIGLGLAERFARQGWHVIATARNPDGARELWELERDYKGAVELAQLDVTSDTEASALARTLAGRTVDVLVNNAGVLPSSRDPFERVSDAAMLKAFEVNVLGPMRVIRALLPNLKRSPQPVVATLSSKVGSIADNTSGGMYAYRVSKTAVNMLNKSLSIDHPGLTCVVLHPGWVQTEMGGSEAPLTVEASAQGLVDVIERVRPADSGRFFDYQGKELPW